MRKIIVSEMVTVDGYFAGPSGEIDWHNVDDEFNRLAIDQLNSIDTLMFGRVTYELMAGYWPTPAGLKDDPAIAEKMNSLEKIVFSKTLKKLEWNNSKLVSEISREEILKMKKRPGKDIIIFGSGIIVSALEKLGLIDEYRLMVNPVVLGNGKSLFKDIGHKIDLKLLRADRLKSGNVSIYYRPIKK